MTKRIRNFFIPTEKNNYIPHALRKRSLVFVSVFLIAVKIIAIFSLWSLPMTAELAVKLDQQDIVNRTNQFRIDNGLGTLGIHPKLTQIAEERVDYIFETGVFSHSNWLDPFDSVSYNFSRAGENIAMDYYTGKDVVDAWIASPSHRANILSDYQHIGAAFKTREMNGKETTVIVQVFGTPSPEKAPVSTPAPEPENPTPIPPPTPEVKSETAPPPPEPEPVPAPPPSPPEVPKDTTPPEPPMISLPTNYTYTTYLKEIFGKTSEANVEVNIFDNNNFLLTTVASSDQLFRITRNAGFELPEGTHDLSATAKDQAGNISKTSNVAKVIIDKTAPRIEEKMTSALVDYNRDTISIRAYVDDSNLESIISKYDNNSISLQGNNQPQENGKIYTGVFAGRNLDGTKPQIEVEALDKAGNKTSADVSIFYAAGVETGPENSPLATSPAATFLGNFGDYLKYIIILFIFLIAGLLLIKIFKNIKFQHPPTILNTILVLLLAGALLIL